MNTMDSASQTAKASGTDISSVFTTFDLCVGFALSVVYGM